MSSINDSGENEFAYEESSIVGISENTPEEKVQRILKSIKKKLERKRVNLTQTHNGVKSYYDITKYEITEFGSVGD
jgi:hypothetical protein